MHGVDGSADHGRTRRANHIVALMLAIGVALTAGHGVALAETADSDSASSAAAHSTAADAKPSSTAGSGGSEDGSDAGSGGTSATGSKGSDADSDSESDASDTSDSTDSTDDDVATAADPDPSDTDSSADADADAEPSAAAEPSDESDPDATGGEETEDTGAATPSDAAEPATAADQSTVADDATPITSEVAGTGAAEATGAALSAVDSGDETSQEQQDPSASAVASEVASEVASSEPSTTEQASPTESAIATEALVSVTDASALTTTGGGDDATVETDVTDSATVDTDATAAATSPEPLSPLAELLQLPGRIVNAVLQVFGLTSSGQSGTSLFTIVNDLFFAAFRALERLFGLDATPAEQQVVPTLTYTGSTTATTPTVADFLNAASAAYVLGGIPDGLVPFTVDGFQMASTNIFSGMSATVWVTQENQIIIAYQGTTGGSNLLFNPLIAISQTLADMQVIFTDTTPWAFEDALAFARRVQAEAAAQGYGEDAIFVTGHSLGGWEAEYVAQQTGWGGIGFESPGLNTTVEGNGADSGFVNIETYGDPVAYLSTDLPGLQGFMPDYEAGGGSKPHYGSIVMIGDPDASTPLVNVSTLFGKSLIGTVIFMVDFIVNLFQYHLPSVQAYHLDVTEYPGIVTWLGSPTGSVDDGYGDLTIPELLLAASEAGTLLRP